MDTTPQEPLRLIPLKEAAELASKSEATIRRWIREGKIHPHRQPGTRAAFVDEGELRELLGIPFPPQLLDARGADRLRKRRDTIMAPIVEISPSWLERGLADYDTLLEAHSAVMLGLLDGSIPLDPLTRVKEWRQAVSVLDNLRKSNEQEKTAEIILRFVKRMREKGNVQDSDLIETLRGLAGGGARPDREPGVGAAIPGDPLPPSC